MKWYLYIPISNALGTPRKTRIELRASSREHVLCSTGGLFYFKITAFNFDLAWQSRFNLNTCD